MKKTSGFTMIEVLIFITILSVFFVTAAAVVTGTLRNQQINFHKIQATRYAQEALEWVRGEKETNWVTFTSHNSKRFCIPANTFNWSTEEPEGGCPQTIDSLFSRTLELSSANGDTNQIDVQVLVTWNEYGRTYSVPVNTSFTVWER